MDIESVVDAIPKGEIENEQLYRQGWHSPYGFRTHRAHPTAIYSRGRNPLKPNGQVLFRTYLHLGVYYPLWWRSELCQQGTRVRSKRRRSCNTVQEVVSLAARQWAAFLLHKGRTFVIFDSYSISCYPLLAI